MNNFNQSSTCVNLELSCFYDTDLSTMYFEDDIKKCDYSDYYLFSNFDYDLSDISNYKCTKKDLLNVCLNGLIDNQDSIEYFNKSLKYCNKDQLIELINDLISCSDVIDLYIEHLKPKFEIITSIGYSQRDYVEVIVPHNLEYKPSQKHIDYLFWDSPIYCRLEIDKDEFYFNEYLLDVYQWDRDLIIEKFSDDLKHNKKDYIIQWLNENLPEYPEYL